MPTGRATFGWLGPPAFSAFWPRVQRPCVGTLTDVPSTAGLEAIAAHQDLTTRLKVAHEVHDLRLSGMSWDKIARKVGLTSRATTILHSEYIAHLRELDVLGALDDARRTQDARYESLLTGIWDRALDGDLNAVREARAILDSISNREMKVTAMITKSAPDGSTATLVAEGSTEDYIRALQEMSQ